MRNNDSVINALNTTLVGCQFWGSHSWRKAAHHCVFTEGSMHAMSCLLQLTLASRYRYCTGRICLCSCGWHEVTSSPKYVAINIAYFALGFGDAFLLTWIEVLKSVIIPVVIAFSHLLADSKLQSQAIASVSIWQRITAKLANAKPCNQLQAVLESIASRLADSCNHRCKRARADHGRHVAGCCSRRNGIIAGHHCSTARRRKREVFAVAQDREVE